MKIALVHLARNMDGTPVSPIVDHLGLESIAGTLEAEGHDVVLFDSGPEGLNDDEVLSALCAATPELVGFALNYANVRDTLSLLANARRELPGVAFVAGSHYATFHAEHLLKRKPYFDAVVLGEGERPLSALSRSTRERWKYEVPGLALIDGGKVIKTGFIPPPNLDNLPRANRNVLKYMANLPVLCGKVAIEASRGCSHNCNFCSIAACQALTGISGQRRLRSPRTISEEIDAIVNDWGLKDFWFMDADFLGNDKRRILEIAEGIRELDYDLSIEIDARADSVHPESIRALRSAGLKRVFLGIESFDQMTLNSFAKGATVNGNLRAIEILRSEDVRPIIGSIIFHPRSTLDQIRRDHAYLSEIGYDKTQMLFRLKKYRGSRDANEGLDCQGCGVFPMEDYGWEIEDPHIQFIWDLFDQARLKLLDEVFITLTTQFRRGMIDSRQFQKQADRIFNGLGPCMDLILESVFKDRRSRIINKKQVEREISKLIQKIVINSKSFN